MKFLATIIATWFYTGYIRPFSGTWGSLFSLPFACGVLWYGGSVLLMLSTALLFTLGYLAIEKLALDTNEDPSYVVIDETLGIFVTFCFIPETWLSIYSIVIGFLLFRLFDIWKPSVIGVIDTQFAGSAGILLDDVAAGLFAGLVLYLIMGS